MTTVPLYAAGALPRMDEFDWLVIMGGPMSANDEAHYDWMRPEKALIASAIECGKTVLGVCLGAQLMATALGASVYPNRVKEIGWFPVFSVGGPESSPLPPEFLAFHWHGETFDVPPRAVLLAGSEACRHQAFRLGPRVVGLQFHLESTESSVRELLANASGDLCGGPYEQPAHSLLAPLERFHAIEHTLYALLDAMAGA